eukprot:5072764-Ditylum_brightwellii.AAC.1
MMEVVHEEVELFAMSLVLSGGCIAVFLGPASQLATTGIFGENLEYFGLFMMIAVFNAVDAILVTFVKFPEKEDDSTKDLEMVEDDIFCVSRQIFKLQQHWHPLHPLYGGKVYVQPNHQEQIFGPKVTRVAVDLN